MNSETSLAADHQEFQFYLQDDFAMMKISKNAFAGLTDLDISQNYLSLLDRVNEDANIKGLIVLSENGGFNDSAYNQYLSRILSKEINNENLDSLLEYEKKKIRGREINTLNRVIQKTYCLKKIVIVGLRGTVVTPFFGSVLAADFRIATDDMVFSLNHVKYGIHPSGALAFFLPRYLGQGRAMEILLKRDKITANEAMELGLINDIVHQEDLEERCLAEAEKLSGLDPKLIEATKRLAYSFNDEISCYFDTETKYF